MKSLIVLIALMTGMTFTHAQAQTAPSTSAECKFGNFTESYVRALFESRRYQVIQNGRVLENIQVSSGANECLVKTIVVRFVDGTTETFAVTLDDQGFRYSVQAL